MYALSFLVVVLFIFDASLVTARPRQRRSPTPVVVPEGLNTNAKRFAAGLPPLPPVRRWVGSKVDTARRQAQSLTPQVRMIEVRDANGHLGWLSDKLTGGHFTLKQNKQNADKFTANFGSSGITYPVDFKDSVDKYLAGLLSPGTTLTSASGFATLGLSSKVPFGPPQVNNPSIGGNPSETAIWSYDSFTKGVTGLWINQSPTPPTSLFIWYDGQKDTFYLTGSPNRPTSASSIVNFYFVLDQI